MTKKKHSAHIEKKESKANDFIEFLAEQNIDHIGRPGKDIEFYLSEYLGKDEVTEEEIEDFKGDWDTFVNLNKGTW